jgi:signal transduction histidine kinase/CheY-like chemotaxis protein
VQIPRSLALLVVAALLPLAILAAGLGVVSLRQQREAMQRDAMARTDVLAALVDRELAAQTRIVQAVAASPVLRDPLDRRAVEAYFDEVRTRQPYWRRLTLTDAEGRIILAAPELAPGTPPVILDKASVARAVQTGRAQVGNVGKSGSNPPGIPVRAPVIRDGRVAYVVSAAIEPAAIGEMLNASDLPRGWLAAVVDRNGIFAARIPDGARRVGTAGSRDLRHAVARGGSGFYNSTTLEGVAAVTAHRTLDASGWSVHIAIPTPLFAAPYERARDLLILEAMVTALLVAIFLWLLSKETRARARASLAREEGQRLEALGRITGGVAHDFNNMLMIVQGSAESIKRRASDPDRVTAFADAIITAAGRGKTLTRQLLAFGRRSAHEPVNFRLQDRIEPWTEVLKRVTRDDITVSVFVPDDVGPIHADPDGLEIALINLAVNARDAMPAGGHLAVTAFNASLGRGRDQGAGLEGEFIAVVVADSGEGIAPEHIARVFEPFFTTKAEGKGTGLGLSQVYGFARQSGGTVTVESAPGEGTSISLFLPRATAEPAAVAAPRAPAAHQQGRVLLVEDNDEVASAMRGMLASAGFEVVRAADAAEALRIVDGGEAFDVVLSDIVMPGGMSGLELAPQIEARRPGLPIVMMTGYSERLADGPAIGRPLLFKPFAAADLVQALSEAMRGAASA